MDICVRATRRDGGPDARLNIPLDLLLTLFKDFYEVHELLSLHFVYRKTDRVLEAGCGIGYVTFNIAMRVEAVIGVEARSDAVWTARANVLPMPNAKIFEGVLALKSGPVTFYERELAYASSVLDQKLGHDKVDKQYEAEGICADELIAAERINCLHLDLEGGELDLVEGIDLSPIQKILLEVHGYIYGRAGVVRIWRRMKTAGFLPLVVVKPNAMIGDLEETFVISFVRPELVPDLRTEDIRTRTMFWAQWAEGDSIDMALTQIAFPKDSPP